MQTKETESRIYAVTVGRLSDGERVLSVMQFDTEQDAARWADDINRFHSGLVCGVHYKEDMERYISLFE
jgi:hypothetical protein